MTPDVLLRLESMRRSLGVVQLEVTVTERGVEVRAWEGDTDGDSDLIFTNMRPPAEVRDGANGERS